MLDYVVVYMSVIFPNETIWTWIIYKEYSAYDEMADSTSYREVLDYEGFTVYMIPLYT
jgi:hypothetical protein